MKNEILGISLSLHSTQKCINSKNKKLNFSASKVKKSEQLMIHILSCVKHKHVLFTFFVAKQCLYWPEEHHTNHHNGKERHSIASHPHYKEIHWELLHWS